MPYAAGKKHLAREAKRRWAARNREKVRAKNRRWYLANRERLIALRVDAARRNPEATRAYRRAFEARTGYRRLYYLANREKAVAYTKAYWAEHPERRRIHHATDWRKRRARKHAAGGRHTEREWRALLERFEFRCAWCGQSGVFLEHDHVVPISRGGTDSIDNIVPACRECNLKKSATFRMPRCGGDA